MREQDVRTAYLADRAAALAGVPKSTLHYWARTGLLVPSVAAERVKLWSFEDLMSLRVIDWLRANKADPQGRMVARTPTPAIRRALKQIQRLDQALWSEERGPAVRVDRAGRIYTRSGEVVTSEGGQIVMGEILDLLAPFDGARGIKGPDLRRPRPHLRIVQGKLAGQPHVEETRVETRALFALASRGFAVTEIIKMYPFLKEVAVEEALDLESQLARNLAA